MYKYFFNKCKAINKLTPRYKMEQRERDGMYGRERERGRSSATRKLIKNPLKETRNKQKLFSVENKTKTKKKRKIFCNFSNFSNVYHAICFVLFRLRLSRFCHIFYTLFTHITAAHGAP